VTPTYLDPDTPLRPPTVRDLIPSYAWAWPRVDMTWKEFDAMPFDLHAMGHPERGSLEPYRANTARYGETVGAWYLVRPKRHTESGVQNEHVLIYIDDKPVIEEFHDPYHDLSKTAETIDS
jgi:hypothetical protein